MSTTTEAPTTTNHLKHVVRKTLPDNMIIEAKIELYECGRNGHEHFSITGSYGTKREFSHNDPQEGGCIHERILKHFPQFKIFVDLHLCDQDGVPMHAIANGLYHMQQGKLEYLKEHLRATDNQMKAIIEAEPRTDSEFSHTLEKMGFRSRWKSEAVAAIAQLETRCNQVFESKATRPGWEPLTAEELATIEERQASGYYEPAAIAARDQEKKDAEMADKLQSAENDYQKSISLAEKKRQVAVYLIKRGIPSMAAIYYDHTNTIGFNWSGLNQISLEKFDAFVSAADLSELPEGIKFEYKDR